MAGRPLQSYDTDLVRNEAGVDPFTAYVRNGMRPTASAVGKGKGPAKTGQDKASGGPSPALVLALLQLLLGQRK